MHSIVGGMSALRMAAALLTAVWLSACVGTSLEQGRRAYAAGDWTTARRVFADHLYAADPEIIVLWGDLLREGKGGPVDLVGAARAYAAATRAGHVLAKEKLRSLADGGNAEALYQAALTGAPQGTGRKEDLERAAALGHPEASAWLGHLRVSEQRYDEAHELLGAAAREGVLAAGFTLALMHFDGTGTPPNPAEAERILAETGTTALARVGITAEALRAQKINGRPIIIDGTSGPPGFMGLGDYLADNPGILQLLAWRGHAEEDLRAGRIERGLVFLRALAAIPTHERDSAERIAQIYDDGEGVPEDDQEAMRWYERAAAAGSETAPDRLRELRRAAARKPVQP